MPLTGTATPGTGPGAGPGTWSRGRAAAVGPEHGAGHSSYGRAQSPSDLGGQSPPHRPSCDSPPPPSPRRHRHRCLASRRGPLPLALGPTPAPRAHVPLFRPLEANPEMGLRYPPGQDAPSGNFFKKSFSGIMTPPGDGTRAPKISNRFLAGGEDGEGSPTVAPKKACTRFYGVIGLRPRGKSRIRGSYG